MDQMLIAMSSIRSLTDDTAGIISEIDSIAKETGGLAVDAQKKATKMQMSAGGFGVVAIEIQKLSRRCSETVEKMRELEIVAFGRNSESSNAGHNKIFRSMISDLELVAISTNQLGVNAAIEASHVEGAGKDFRDLTDTIHNLATRTTDAAMKTEQLIQAAVTNSRNGEELSLEIDI